MSGILESKLLSEQRILKCDIEVLYFIPLLLFVLISNLIGMFVCSHCLIFYNLWLSQMTTLTSMLVLILCVTMKELCILKYNDTMDVTFIPTNSCSNKHLFRINEKVNFLKTFLNFPRIIKKKKLVVLEIKYEPTNQLCKRIEHLASLQI